MLGLDHRAARLTWTGVFILLLLDNGLSHSRNSLHLCSGVAVRLTALAVGELS